MGKRSEPRKEIQVPVRIFGTDSRGKMFSANALTVNVSHQGLELSGVECQLNLDEIIGLTYGKNRVHFRIKWVGQPGTPKAGHVGLLNASNKTLILYATHRGSGYIFRRKSPHEGRVRIVHRVFDAWIAL